MQVVEQVLRNIRKDHPAHRASLESAKGDEAITTAHIQESVPVGQPRVDQHSVSHRTQLVQRGLQPLRITTVTAMQQPVGPNVCG